MKGIFFPFFKKKNPNSPPQWKHGLTLVLQHQKMVISKQLQQARAFLALQCIALGLGLVYLGEYFQNEEAEGLKALVVSPKAGQKKKNLHLLQSKNLVMWSVGKS